MVLIEIEVSESGFPFLWEEGGGWTNTGECRIITDSLGLPKSPIYIRTKGELCNSEHALIPIKKGDFIVDASHHRKDFVITILKIEEIMLPTNKLLIAKESFFFKNGSWNNQISPQGLLNAVEAAMRKATTYHCRKPFYIVD